MSAAEDANNNVDAGTDDKRQSKRARCGLLTSRLIIFVSPSLWAPSLSDPFFIHTDIFSINILGFFLRIIIFSIFERFDHFGSPGSPTLALLPSRSSKLFMMLFLIMRSTRYGLSRVFARFPFLLPVLILNCVVVPCPSRNLCLARQIGQTIRRGGQSSAFLS